ncbi:S1 family peptidase [Streptomyces sp. NPDC057638]|uniref:S1 family peptidase n=1 Tax=Streptomyces sp. NPDC057638 TaxID=3346190 RepID=UPI00367BEAD4
MFRVLRAALCATIALLCAAVALPAAAAGPPAPVVRGGDSLYGAGVSCTVGFNVRRGNVYYALVSGACADRSPSWYADPAGTLPVGRTALVGPPSRDFALIQYTNPAISPVGEVNLLNGGVRDITDAALPVSGQSYCHVGQVSGLRCGTWTPQGTACSVPGDIGGPAFSGGTALGLISRSSGVCPAGTTSGYEPVLALLAAYGLTVY